MGTRQITSCSRTNSMDLLNIIERRQSAVKARIVDFPLNMTELQSTFVSGMRVLEHKNRTGT